MIIDTCVALSLPEATLLCAAVKWEETKGTPMSLHMVLEQLDVYKRQEVKQLIPRALCFAVQFLWSYVGVQGIAALGMVMSKLTAEKVCGKCVTFRVLRLYVHTEHLQAWERLFALCIIRPVGVASATASLAGPLNDATGGSAAVAMTSSHHRRTTDGPVARASPVVDIHAVSAQLLVLSLGGKSTLCLVHRPISLVLNQPR